MNDEEKRYTEMVKHLETTYPKMFAGKYGGLAIGEGWWPLVEQLCNHIQLHIDQQNSAHERWPDDPYYKAVPQVTIQQIKEKFGGLRFYFEGGDEYCRGAAWFAEKLSTSICETCGAPGKQSGDGWIKTLCPTHAAERDEERRKRFSNED